ncbi:MAG: D-alanyl-D-alanine carboxypeptidase family protein [Eubacteriales bacterium]
MSDTVPETSGGLGNEEVICFYIDSQQADINGQTVRLDIPNRIRGTEVWVSASFVTEYMNNLSLQYNEKKGVVSISRIVDEENSTEDVTVYLPVSFKLKDIDALDPLPEDSTAEETDESSETDDLLTLPEEKPVSAPAEETDESSQTDDLLTLPEDKPVSAPAEETDESSQTDDLLTLPEDKPVSAPAEEDELPYTMDELNFQTDLTEYEPYMEPADRDAYLRLVNPTHLIEESELPNDLVDCIYTAAARSTQTLRLSAARALEALFLEMKAAGFDGMEVYSGYRSIEYQSVLFERYTQNELAKNPSLTREEAEKIVLTYSTRPGTSEHHTGLAVDMDTLGTFSTDFAYTPEYAWLSENAWKFGFILRFPADKTEITTIQFEPWHYRFVGRYHAKKIHDAGMCLEEYVELLSAGI